MVCCLIGQFISFLVEKTFGNVYNLESRYMVYGNDTMTISEKLIGVIAALVMNENNADLHRAEEKQIPQTTHNKFKHFSLVYYYCRTQALHYMFGTLQE